MNLTKPFGRRDAVSGLEGDERFIGVDERTPAQSLPPGYVARGVNLRFRKGRAETRGGIAVVPWMKSVAGFAPGYTPWNEVYTAAVFSDPNQPAEWFVIAADGGVWKTRPNMTASPVPLPPDTSLSAASAIMFVQCFNVLILLRGPDYAPLVCTNLDVGFTAVPAHTPPEGEEPDPFRDMPKSSFGLFYLNRLWLIEGKDTTAVSDILSYTNFAAVTNELRINQGNTDRLVALTPLARGTVICLKDQSVLALTGLTMDLTTATLDEVTGKYGLEAWRGVVRSGRNLYWVSEGGHVVSLKLTEQNEVQDTHERLSEPMIQTFGQVNPLYVSGAAAEVWDGKLYVALPVGDATHYSRNRVLPGAVYWVDAPVWSPTACVVAVTAGQKYFYQQAYAGGTYSLTNGTQTLGASGWFTAQADTVTLNRATTVPQPLSPQPVADAIYEGRAGMNNAVAVYDFANEAWCGVDQAEGVVNVRHWLKTTYRGRKRLFAIGADGVLRLYEEGVEDEVLEDGVVTCQGVATELVTRGYKCQAPLGKRYTHLALGLRTWAPRYTIATQGPAKGSRRTHRAAVTQSAVESDVHGVAAYDPTNDNDDHGAAGRQDYSVEATAEGFEVGAEGIELDAHQARLELVPVDEQGLWCQGIVTNDQGRVEVESAMMEAVPNQA